MTESGDRSVGGVLPESRGGELEAVSRGVAKVDRPSAVLPALLVFDLHAMGHQFFSPEREIRSLYRPANMFAALAPVGRDLVGMG